MRLNRFKTRAQDTPSPDCAVSFSEVEAAEQLEIARRRAKFNIHLPPGEELGLSISGGGIRSATFSLGIIQKLAERGVLKHLDYLSTVSGGGYIGSWLYSWIHRHQPAGSDPVQGFDHVVEQLKTAKTSEAVEITFLRQYSSYLTPRKSVLSADTWVVGAIWARNTLLNLAILVALCASIVLLVRGAALLGFQHNWPDQDDEWSGALAWSVGLLAPMIALIALNLWKISTIALRKNPPLDRAGEAPDWVVVIFCAFPLASAVVYSFWLARARSVFVEGTLWHGVKANFITLFFGFLAIQLCSRLYSCHLETQKKVTGKYKFSDRLYAAFIDLLGPLASAFVTAAMLCAIASILDLRDSQPDQPWFVLTWGPPLVLMAFTLGMIVHIGLMGRDLPEASREWLGRLRGWLFIVQAGWIVVVGISIYGPWLLALLGVTSQRAVAALGTGWIISSLAGLFAGGSGKTSGKTPKKNKRSTSILEIVAAVGPYAFMFGFMLVVTIGTHLLLTRNLPVHPPVKPPSLTEKYDLQKKDGKIQLTRELKTDEAAILQSFVDRYWLELTLTEFSAAKNRWQLSGLGPLLAVLLVAGGLLTWRVDINLFSMHNFYKNRLVRCYLGASRQAQRQPNPFTGFDDFDDTPLDQFKTEANYHGPYPIVNAALNVTSGGKLQYQERQAESFIFTPAYTGFSAGTTVNEMRLGDEPHKLLASYQTYDQRKHKTRKTGGGDEAMAYRPSSTAGGRVSVGMAVAISGAAVNPNMGYHTSTAISFLLTVFNVRLGWWLGNALKPSFRNPGPPLGLLYAMRELFGMANADSRYVNLSDGGHFDNMGIYELVRRRCRYIICCDGEQDEDLDFGGLGNAIRKCRTDFGVDIDLSVKPLLKVKGFSARNFAVGTINYIDAKPGYLVYLKASLTGDEPTDVRQYHAAHSEFPHQSTNDQWFDESQFESYRKLGYYIASAAFSKMNSGVLIEEDTREQFFKGLQELTMTNSATS